MDIYDINYLNPEDGDLYAISIVDDAANGLEFIALSKEKKLEVKLADKKKQLLTGVVLIPEQLIYREFEDGTPFKIKFSAETIERLSQDFLIKGYQSNSTYNHSGGYLEGITLVEQWIVQDSNNDKAKALGFDVPEGTWMVTFKLSDELWEEFILSGKAKGFSIDSFLDLKKISMKSQSKINKKEKMSLLKRLIKMFAEGDEANLVTISIEGMGDLVADAFEVGNVVYQDVEGDLVPLADSGFEYEGFAFITDADGVIAEKNELEAVELNENGDPIEAVEDSVEAVEELLVIVEKLEEAMAVIEAEKEVLIAENVEMKAKLAKKPNATKLKAVPADSKGNATPNSMDTLRSIIAQGKRK